MTVVPSEYFLVFLRCCLLHHYSCRHKFRIRGIFFFFFLITSSSWFCMNFFEYISIIDIFLSGIKISLSVSVLPLLLYTPLIAIELFAGNTLPLELDMHDGIDWSEIDFVVISFIVWGKSLIMKALIFNSSQSSLNICIPFFYISSQNLFVKVYLFRSSSFLIETSISLVILFKIIVFSLLNLAFSSFSNILWLKNSDWSISYYFIIVVCFFRYLY